MDFSFILEASPSYIVGQCIGFVAVVVSFFIYYVRNRKHFLISKLIADVLSAVQQGLMCAGTGAIINLFAIVREVVFYNRLSKSWAKSRLWLYAFILLFSLAPALSWAGPISLIPAVGSALAVIGFYMSNPTTTRKIGIVAQLLWLIYCVLTFNIAAVLQNAVQIVAAILGIIRDRRLRSKSKKESFHEQCKD